MSVRGLAEPAAGAGDGDAAGVRFDALVWPDRVVELHASGRILLEAAPPGIDRDYRIHHTTLQVDHAVPATTRDAVSVADPHCADPHGAIYRTDQPARPGPAPAGHR